MTKARDFLKMKNAPTLQIIKTLEAIEAKALKAVKDAVANAVSQTVDEMREAGLAMVADIAKKKTIGLKAEIMKRISAEVMEDIMQIVSEPTNKILFKGDPGKQGSPGAPGKEGKTPLKDIDFFDGEKGEKGESVQGKPGEPGTDGSPDTGKQIVKKLNDTKGLVGLHVIKGLEEMLTNMRIKIRAGGKGGAKGGGMGSPVDFQFIGDGATTDFTLASAPSGNGNIKAIWVNYMGQQQHPVTHFTVSGKTLSMTFTPKDGAIIEGILLP